MVLTWLRRSNNISVLSRSTEEFLPFYDLLMVSHLGKKIYGSRLFSQSLSLNLAAFFLRTLWSAFWPATEKLEIGEILKISNVNFLLFYVWKSHRNQLKDRFFGTLLQKRFLPRPFIALEIDLSLTSKSTWHIVLAKRGDPIIRPPRAFKGFFQRTMKGKSKIIWKISWNHLIDLELFVSRSFINWVTLHTKHLVKCGCLH